MSEFAVGDDVSGRFHGRWYPGQILEVHANVLLVLWDEEFSCSLLERCDVVKRAICQQVFNMAACDSDEEQRASNASNSAGFSTDGLSPSLWLSQAIGETNQVPMILWTHGMKKLTSLISKHYLLFILSQAYVGSFI